MSAPPPLKKVKQGIDPAVQSAYEAAQGVMGSLREKGMEEVTIDAATATALG